MSIVNSTVTFKTSKAISPQSEDVYKKRKKTRKPNPFRRKILRDLDNGVTYLCYESGQIVMLGAKSEEIVRKSLIWFTGKTQADVTSQPDIKNLVYIFNTGRKFMKLNDLCYRIREMGYKARYEPELCPAVVFNLARTKATVLVYTSGKVTVTGVTDLSDLLKSVYELNQNLGSPIPDLSQVWNESKSAVVLKNLHDEITVRHQQSLEEDGSAAETIKRTHRAYRQLPLCPVPTADPILLLRPQLQQKSATPSQYHGASLRAGTSWADLYHRNESHASQND